MEFLGDLERAFATSIYPNRVLVAAAALAFLTILALVAWRRGWVLAARRRPRRTVAVSVIGLAVAGPLFWYLASPLVITRTIDEPPPIAAAETRPSASAPPDAAATSLPSDEPAPFASASAFATETPVPPPTTASLIERTGPFAGADEFHFGRGTARLIETAPGAFTVRLESFAVRNGPDLYVYLSPSADGYAADALELGPLKADQGNQNYRVPEGTDVTGAQSVVIWCKQFGVLFATAPLV